MIKTVNLKLCIVYHNFFKKRKNIAIKEIATTGYGLRGFLFVFNREARNLSMLIN